MENQTNEKRCFLCRVIIGQENDECENNTCKFCPEGSDKIYYCCEDHLSVHRGNLRKKKDSEDILTCWPFRIETKPDVGRIMVAIRDIRAGEIILEEMPAVWGPNNKSAAVCLGCLKPAIKVLTKNDDSDNEIQDVVINTCSKCHFPICGIECKYY